MNPNASSREAHPRSFYTWAALTWIGLPAFLVFLPSALMAQSAPTQKASSVFAPVSAPAAHYATLQEAMNAGKEAIQDQRWADALTAFLAAETMTSNPQDQAVLEKWVEYVEAKRGTAGPATETSGPGSSNSAPPPVYSRNAVDISKVKATPVPAGAYRPGNFGGVGVWLLHGDAVENLIDPITTLESFNPGFGAGAGYFAPIGSHFKLGPDLDYLTYSNTKTITYFPPGSLPVPVVQSLAETEWEISLDGQIDLSAPHDDYSYLLMGLGAAFQKFSGNGTAVSATSPMARLGAGGNLIEQKGFCAFVELRFNLIYLGQSAADSLGSPSGLILEVPLNIGIGLD